MNKQNTIFCFEILFYLAFSLQRCLSFIHALPVFNSKLFVYIFILPYIQEEYDKFIDCVMELNALSFESNPRWFSDGFQNITFGAGLFCIVSTTHSKIFPLGCNTSTLPIICYSWEWLVDKIWSLL